MNKKFAWLAISVSIAGLVSGCSKAPESAKTDSSTGTKTEAAKPAETADSQNSQSASATGGSTANTAESGSADSAETESAEKPTASATSATGKEQPLAQTAKEAPKTELASNPSAENAAPKANPAQQNVNVDNLGPEMVILTVSGTPVTVGEYRRMFKMQQVQLESLAMNNPMLRANLLNQAKQMKISLTPDEKAKLLAAAHKAKAPDEAGFQKFLKSQNLTKAQFDQEISEVGVAVKTVNAVLQQSLLNDLVNRELLASYAKQAGMAGKAMNHYVEFKHTPDFKLLSDATKLTAEDLHQEIVKNELSKLMMEKIQTRAAVSDQDLQSFYDQNKSKFQHKERIRMSQIIVAAPNIDSGGVQSVRSQIKKENPKLEGKELDDKVKQVMEVQRQKATAILTMAKQGKNFAELANTLSDDMQVKKTKNGGDMGYQDKEQLIPEFSKAIWPLKSGEVYGGLVQSALGYHVVKVTAHEGAGIASLAEIKPQLRELLLQQKKQQIVNNWLQDKRKTAKLVLTQQFASLLQNAPQTSSLNTNLH
jgi:parvulin-like peptidyl-prolyl isomerase